MVFDGPPDHGLGGTRVASGLSIRYSGRTSADSLLDRLVADAIGTGGTPDEAHRAADAILVVTDDIELGRAIRRRGSRTAGAVWLVRRLGRSVLSAPTTGVRRAPSRHPPARPATTTTGAAGARPRSDEEDRQSAPRATAPATGGGPG